MTVWNVIETSNEKSIPRPQGVFNARHFIDGRWIDPVGTRTFARACPATDQLVSLANCGTAEDAERAILAARAAFGHKSWRYMPGAERAIILNRVADLIALRRDELALYESLESGKPISQARNEMEACVGLWRYAATVAHNVRGESQNGLGRDMLGMILKEPVGVVSIITPWNFPLLIVSQKLPFALAAGCTAVVKPSEMTVATTTKLFEILEKVGLPDGVANLVLGFVDPVGHLMTSHDQVDMVSFTGSTAVGKQIVATTSNTLKKVSLELGGKNPQVIFPDGDLDAAADAVVFGVYFNAGECCNSSSRVLVHDSIAETFASRLVALSAQVPVGDPLNPDVKVGPLISEEHRSKVQGYVDGAINAGATVRCGGKAMTATGGFYFQPTILTNVRPDMAVVREEIFGPVLSVLTFSDLEEAISLVNDSRYGLSAGLWSDDIHTCLEFSRRIEAGTVWVNSWMDGYPELPFGGVKQSGLGREMGSCGIEEFLDTKTIQMRIGGSRQKWLP